MSTAQQIDEKALLRELGFGDRFKSLAELKSFMANAESAVKERDGYKSRFSTYGKAASEAGFKTLDEVFKTAAEARKKSEPSKNGFDLKGTMSELYNKTYGAEEHARLMKEDPRMFDFWSSAIQAALGTIPTDKYLTQDKLDELTESIADQFAERDFFGGLEGDERKLANQFKKDIRRIYADEKLYNVPEGADETYSGFAEAWKRHKAGLEKAGMKMTNDNRQPSDEPARRIAFPGNAIPSSAADDKFRPGPGFDERAFLKENPELQDADGNFDWAKGFSLGKE